MKLLLDDNFPLEKFLHSHSHSASPSVPIPILILNCDLFDSYDGCDEFVVR